MTSLINFVVVVSMLLVVVTPFAFSPRSLHVSNPRSHLSSPRVRSNSLLYANNVVLSPSAEQARFDSMRIGCPKVHRYVRDGGEHDFVMWYVGRAIEASDSFGHANSDRQASRRVATHCLCRNEVCRYCF